MIGVAIDYWLFAPSKKSRIFDIEAERKAGREARRIDYLAR